MATCDKFGNTGLPICPDPKKVAAGIVFGSLIKADSSENKITNGSMDKATLQAAYDNVTPQDRLYPILGLENVEDVRGETVFHSMNSGKKYFVKEGERAFTAIVPLKSNLSISEIEKWRGKEFGCYILDKDGNVIYNRAVDRTDSDYYLIPIEGGSFVVDYVKATDSEVPHLMIQFDFDDAASDSDLDAVLASEIDHRVLSSSNTYGLRPVYPAYTSPTATTVTIELKDVANNKITGILLADMLDWENSTDASTFTITSITETATGSGIYNVVYPTQTSADVIAPKMSKTRLSFDYLGSFTIA